MIIEIDPLDTLFFRDGKPFFMGEETWADGIIFPPFPSVIYGALRTAYFADHIEDIKKANTNEDPTNKLTIKGIYLKYGEDIYFPLPLDCVREKGKKKDQVFVIEHLFNICNRTTSSLITDCILIDENNRQIENIEDGVLRISALKKYLNNKINKNFSIKMLSDLGVTESKIGIGRNNQTRSSDESRLYRVGMRRLKNTKILVHFEGLDDFPTAGVLKFGGEHKAAAYQNTNDDISINTPEIKDNRFKLYLTTPSFFKNGWLPSWIDNKTFKGTYNGIRLKLLTAVIGKYISIGGFDIKKVRPKPMRRAVPAGSVYYFTFEGDSKDVKCFHHQSISEDNNTQKEGYGITLVGGMK